MPFVFAPLDAVKSPGQYPEYVDVLKAVQDAGITRAKELWGGFSQGGLTPGEKQFGIIPMRMNEMANDVTSSTLSGSYSFRKSYTAGAWRNIFNFTTREDTIHALAGFAFADDVLRFSQIRWEIGDKKYPIIDLQLAQTFPGFALVFKEDVGKEIIIEQEQSVLVKGYCESTGPQRIVPIGFMLFKRKDLVISET